MDAAPDRLAPVLVVDGTWDHRRERVHVFELRLPGEPPLRPDGREVVEARLVDRAALGRVRLAPPAAAYAATLSPPPGDG